MGRSFGDTRFVVIGGGLSGMGCALALAHAGASTITIVERGAALGGLAGSFHQSGHAYPLGYHHILRRDHTLQFFLRMCGALDDVRWRRIQMLFEHEDRLFDLKRPLDFLRFPLPVLEKARFARLMVRSGKQRDWRAWEGRSADELIDRWASPRIRRVLFDPLTMLKFRRPCREVSAAWMGERLSYREGTSPVGYIPRRNWTEVLTEGLTDRLRERECTIELSRTVTEAHTDGARLRAIRTADGTTIAGDVFVSAIPVPAHVELLPEDSTPGLTDIRYTSLVSTICATRTAVRPHAYWINLSSLRHGASAIFLLSALNPTIGEPGETCVNFVTHLDRPDAPFLDLDDAATLARYDADFREVFGVSLEPKWAVTNRVRSYSPIFSPGYRPPPVRSERFQNVWFTGTARTYPSVASTGTALDAGLETATAILDTFAMPSDLANAVAAFRPERMQRA